MNREGEEGSAAIDPYELVQCDPAEDAQIAEWIAHVEKELRGHRSPFIAAVFILQQMNQKVARMKQPDKLYLETAFHVLEFCGGHLTSPFKEIFISALHEVLPAVMFTRATYSPETGLERVEKHSYAECFLAVYKIYLDNRHRVDVHERRMVVEQKVMNRLISKLKGMWLKFCFSGWRTHCIKIRQKKHVIAKIAKFSLSNQIAPTLLQKWRRYAHMVVSRSKMQKSEKLNIELKDLRSEVEALTAAASILRSEVAQETKQLFAANLGVEAAAEKLKDVDELLEATIRSEEEHWREWQRCKELLFDDMFEPPADKFQGRGFRDEKGDFISNVTDSSALYLRRARLLSSKMGVDYLHRVLMLYGLFVPHDPHVIVPHFLKQPALSLTLESTRALVSASCGHVVSPLFYRDIVRAHKDNIRFATSFLHFVFSGGHCSLFPAPPLKHGTLKLVRHSRGTESGFSLSQSRPTPSRASFSSAEEQSLGVDAEQEEEVRQLREITEETVPEQGASERMMEDVSKGLERLQGTCDAAAELSESIRQCVTNAGVDGVRNYLEGVFERLSTIQNPLDRIKIESITFTLLENSNDFLVLQALYPQHGIATFTDLVNYITSVTEFTGWPILQVAETLESQYKLDLKDHMTLILDSTDAVVFFAMNHKVMHVLQTNLRKNGEKEVLCAKKVGELFIRRLDLTQEAFEEIWDEVASEGFVKTSELDKILFYAASWYDPSPFTPEVHKIAAVLECLMPHVKSVCGITK